MLYLLLVLFALKAFQTAADLPPDAGLDIHDLVEKYGYQIEDHAVQTEDDYIVTMHRIRGNLTDSEKLPIFIMHGLLSNSMDFLNLGPKAALAFLLADEGYDVWLGNQRGNRWSTNHTKYNPQDDLKTFYNFSFEEIAIYDLPAKIDHILNTTGHEQIYYIGHSQGTTAFFVLLALKPEYNAKIKYMSALAPIAYVTHIKQFIATYFSQDPLLLESVAESFNITVIFQHSDLFTEIGSTFCADGSAVQFLCMDVLFLIGGEDWEQFNSSFLPVLFTSSPAGASFKQLIHYAQEIKAQKFQRYDYHDLNSVYYGQSTPPEYNISNIQVPIALHYSENDLFAVPEDVDEFALKLPNVVEKRLVPYKNFSHIDYLWANDVVELVYNDVINGIKSN